MKMWMMAGLAGVMVAGLSGCAGTAATPAPPVAFPWTPPVAAVAKVTAPVVPDYVLTNNYQGSAQFMKPLSALGGFQAVGPIYFNGRQLNIAAMVINGKTNFIFVAQPVP